MLIMKVNWQYIVSMAEILFHQRKNPTSIVDLRKCYVKYAQTVYIHWMFFGICSIESLWNHQVSNILQSFTLCFPCKAMYIRRFFHWNIPILIYFDHMKPYETTWKLQIFFCNQCNLPTWEVPCRPASWRPGTTERLAMLSIIQDRMGIRGIIGY